MATRTSNAQASTKPQANAQVGAPSNNALPKAIFKPMEEQKQPIQPFVGSQQRSSFQGTDVKQAVASQPAFAAIPSRAQPQAKSLAQPLAAQPQQARLQTPVKPVQQQTKFTTPQESILRTAPQVQPQNPGMTLNTTKPTSGITSPVRPQASAQIQPAAYTPQAPVATRQAPTATPFSPPKGIVNVTTSTTITQPQNQQGVQQQQNQVNRANVPQPVQSVSPKNKPSKLVDQNSVSQSQIGKVAIEGGKTKASNKAAAMIAAQQNKGKPNAQTGNLLNQSMSSVNTTTKPKTKSIAPSVSALDESIVSLNTVNRNVRASGGSIVLPKTEFNYKDKRTVSIESRSDGGVSKGSMLSQKLSQSLKKVLDRSTVKQGQGSAATKVQALLQKQAEKDAPAHGRNTSGSHSRSIVDVNRSFNGSFHAPGPNSAQAPSVTNQSQVGSFSPAVGQNKARRDSNEIEMSPPKFQAAGPIPKQQDFLDQNKQVLRPIHEQRGRSAQPKDLNSSYKPGVLDVSMDRRSLNDSVNMSVSNQSLNATMIQQAKLEGAVMLEKKRNVKQSRQNMEQLKHRIDALKRNVQQVQKEQANAERHRSVLEDGVRNKERKVISKIDLAEERRNQVEQKRQIAQITRKDRELSKSRSQQAIVRQRSQEIQTSKAMLAERKAALEEKERQLRAKKLMTAAGVRKQKQEALIKKQQRDESYRSRTKQEFYSKIQDQQSIASRNAEEIAELEQQEKQMVEKLNQTRMSAMSAQTQPRRNTAKDINVSPYKPTGNQRQYTSNRKSQQFLGDNDLKDRAQFGRSFNQSHSAMKPKNRTGDSQTGVTPQKAQTSSAVQKASALQAMQQSASQINIRPQAKYAHDAAQNQYSRANGSAAGQRQDTNPTRSQSSTNKSPFRVVNKLQAANSVAQVDPNAQGIPLKKTQAQKQFSDRLAAPIVRKFRGTDVSKVQAAPASATKKPKAQQVKGQAPRQ